MEPGCILQQKEGYQIEGSNERVAMWRMIHGVASSGPGVFELASVLAALPVPVEGREELGRYDHLPGMDATCFRAWAKSLSQTVRNHPEPASWPSANALKLSIDPRVSFGKEPRMNTDMTFMKPENLNSVSISQRVVPSPSS